MSTVLKNVTNVLTTSNTNTVYTAPAATSSIVKGYYITNTTSDAVFVSLYLYDASKSATFKLIETLSLAPYSTLENNVDFYLEAGDYLVSFASVPSAITFFASVVEKA